MNRDVEKRENFIRFLLAGNREMSNEEINLRSFTLGITNLLPPYIVVTISPDYSPVPFKEKDARIFEVRDYVSSALTQRGYKFFLTTDTYNNLQILLADHIEEDELISFFKSLHERIQSECLLNSFIGVGSSCTEPNAIYLSATESHRMLGYKYQYAEQGVVAASSFVAYEYSSMFGSDIVFERVIGCFLDGNIDRMTKRLYELVEHVRNRPNVSRSSIRRTLIELSIRIVNIASNSNIDVDEIIGDRDIYHWIMEQGHTEIITEWILAISATFIKIMKENNATDSNKSIRRACIYIDRNITSPELSLDTISDHVALSPAYLSQLFKAEKGMGIKSYIVKLRINRAKYLLEKSDLKIEDIALQTGYNRVQYFTQVFKKNVGQTPNEYRKDHKKV